LCALQSLCIIDVVVSATHDMICCLNFYRLIKIQKIQEFRNLTSFSDNSVSKTLLYILYMSMHPSLHGLNVCWCLVHHVCAIHVFLCVLHCARPKTCAHAPHYLEE